jgi:fumarate reductase flavoprotein subunit
VAEHPPGAGEADAEKGDLFASTFTVARQQADKLAMTDEPVQFTIVKPGDTILKEQPAVAE